MVLSRTTTVKKVGIPQHIAVKADEIAELWHTHPDLLSCAVDRSSDPNCFIIDCYVAHNFGWSITHENGDVWLLSAKDIGIEITGVRIDLADAFKSVGFSDPIDKLVAIGRIPSEEYWDRPESAREDFLELCQFFERRPHKLSEWSLYSGNQIERVTKELKANFGEDSYPICYASHGRVLALKDRELVVLNPQNPDDGFEQRFRSISDFTNYVEEEVTSDNLQTLAAITESPRYKRAVAWSLDRPGHQNESIADHIVELEENLAILKDEITSSADVTVLRLMIHTHDTFKGEAKPRAPIKDPESHASLGRKFLEEYIGETYLSEMIQRHDELYSIWKKFRKNGSIDEERMSNLIESVKDWDVMLAFTIIDNVTEDKPLESTRWAVEELTLRHNQVDLKLDHRKLFELLVEERGLCGTFYFKPPKTAS